MIITIIKFSLMTITMIMMTMVMIIKMLIDDAHADRNMMKTTMII